MKLLIELKIRINSVNYSTLNFALYVTTRTSKGINLGRKARIRKILN